MGEQIQAQGGTDMFCDSLGVRGKKSRETKRHILKTNNVMYGAVYAYGVKRKRRKRNYWLDTSRAAVWLAASVVTGKWQEVVPTWRWSAPDSTWWAWWEGGGHERLQEFHPPGNSCRDRQLHQWTERQVRNSLHLHWKHPEVHCCFMFW